MRLDLLVTRELRCSEAQLTAPAALSTLSFKQLVGLSLLTSIDPSFSWRSVADPGSVLLSLSSLGLQRGRVSSWSSLSGWLFFPTAFSSSWRSIWSCSWLRLALRVMSSPRRMSCCSWRPSDSVSYLRRQSWSASWLSWRWRWARRRRRASARVAGRSWEVERWAGSARGCPSITVIWNKIDGSGLLADDLLLQQLLGLRRHCQFLHHALQFLGGAEALDLGPEGGHLLRLGAVELATLLLDAFELLQIAQQVVVDDLADLLVLCRVVRELLAVLLDHLLQLRQLRPRLRLPPSVPLVVHRGRRVAVLYRVAQVYRHLLVLLLQLEHPFQLRHLRHLQQPCSYHRRSRRLGQTRWLRLRLLIVDFLLVFVFEALQFLRLEVGPNPRGSRQLTTQLVGGGELSLIGLGNDLKVGADFVLGGCVELVLDDAKEAFVELEEGVYFVLVSAAHLLELLEFFLARPPQFPQLLVFPPQLLHHNNYPPTIITAPQQSDPPFPISSPQLRAQSSFYHTIRLHI